VQPVALSATELITDVAQYGADYWALPAVRTRRAFAFDGADAVGLVPTDVLGNVAWWSNGGEDVVTTLTGAFDLSGLQTATLAFRVWYDLQREYDYGFVSASTDGGTTWRTLRGRHTTAEDPLAGNYGHGYTGASGAGAQGWRDEVIDLTPVAGQRVLVRFSMVTEDSAHHVGMLIDDIRIPELGFGTDAEEATGVWQPVGWVRTDNRLPQRWEVRLVRWAAGSGTRAPTVEPIALDGENRATIQLAAGERAVLVVLATTPFTTERAGYTLRQQQLR